MSQPPAATIPFLDDALGGIEERMEQAVADTAARLRALRGVLAEQSRRLDAAERQSAALERQLAVAEAKLAVESMHAAGLAAQASHLMALALEAGVPALDEAQGGPLAGVYDAAFDARAAELGIEDPARFRAV